MDSQKEITIHINSPADFDHIDVFIYSDTLSGQLEIHRRFAGGRFLRLPAGEGDKFVVGIANVDGEFREDALQTFTEAEGLSARYAMENPAEPLMAGSIAFKAEYGAVCELDILPLLCRVDIGDVSISGNAALTDPVLYLECVSEQAGLLKSSGFYPESTLDSAESLKYPGMMVAPLPFDVGNRPQDAGITLWCYPNESPDGPGSGSTRLCIAGTLKGRHTVFSFSLGPVGRGTSKNVELILGEDGESSSISFL